MREILFRGKRLNNGEWFFGSYLFLHISPVDWTGAKRGKPEDVHYIVNDQDINYAVYPSTIGQYTGLKDKNGKRIFEGDILCFDETVFVCYWDGGNIEFGLRNNEESIGMAYVAVYDAEIIGNVHDNPELLYK